MSFVIATALLFAIIDTVLLRFLIYLSTFRKALSPRIDRWIQDGVLQLQRRAFEAHKEGTWSGLSKEVPLTDAKELLAELPLASLPSANTSTVSTPASGSQSSSAAQPQSNPAPAIITQPTPPQSSPPQPIIHQPTPPQPTSSQSSPPQSPLQQSSLPQPTPPQPIQPRSATHSPVNQGANTPTPLSPSSTP
jgi:outer membrane biosynthesis protein TonB